MKQVWSKEATDAALDQLMGELQKIRDGKMAVDEIIEWSFAQEMIKGVSETGKNAEYCMSGRMTINVHLKCTDTDLVPNALRFMRTQSERGVLALPHHS